MAWKCSRFGPAYPMTEEEQAKARNCIKVTPCLEAGACYIEAQRGPAIVEDESPKPSPVKTMIVSCTQCTWSEAASPGDLVVSACPNHEVRSP